MKAFEMWGFELWEVTYKNLLRNFHHTREIFQIKEMFHLCEVK